MINLDKFQSQKVMVCGDIIADIYEYGLIHRMSREAPIPIVEFESEKFMLGGAGIVIANLASLAATPIPVAVIGQDRSGDQIHTLLSAAGIETGGIVAAESVPTTTKRRILAQAEQSVRQQILRLDRLPQQPLAEIVLQQLWDRCVTYLSEVNAVIISDYLSEYLHSWIPERFMVDLVNEAIRREKKVCVDSRHRLASYKRATLLKPNRAEAAETAGRAITSPAELKAAGELILEKTEAQLLLITLGDDGMALFERGKPMELLPVYNRQEVYDVNGAGDTVIATMCLGLLSGFTPLQAARIANVAAGLVVRKIGAATVSRDELAEAVAKENM